MNWVEPRNDKSLQTERGRPLWGVGEGGWGCDLESKDVRKIDSPDRARGGAESIHVGGEGKVLPQKILFI